VSRSLYAIALLVPAAIGWETNDLVSRERRADLVEKHIMHVEGQAALWLSEVARYESELNQVRHAICARPMLRLNLAHYEQRDALPRLCGE
jgi:hypothetical protein